MEAIDCLNYNINNVLADVIDDDKNDDDDDGVFAYIKCTSYIKLGQWIQESHIMDTHDDYDNNNNDKIIQTSISCFEKATIK